MAAPKGNQFWKLRAKHGPDVLFSSPEALRKAAFEYFELCEENPRYTVEQVTGKGKAVYDDMTGQVIQPEQLIAIPEKRPLTIARLSLYLGVSEAYLRNKRADPKTPKDMLAVIDEIYGVVNSDQQEGGLLGHYNPNLTARLQGIAEVTKNEHTGPNGAALNPPSVLDNLTFDQLLELAKTLRNEEK